MVLDLEELERRALRSESLPEGLTQPQQLLFLSLRVLYREYRCKVITRDEAKKEKAKLLAEFDQAQFHYNMFWNTTQMCNRLNAYLTDIEKNGCERCKTAVRIFDGRDKAV